MIPSRRGPDRDLSIFLWSVVGCVCVVTTILLLLAPAGQAAAVFTSPPRLNETASWLAQRDVTVQCLTPQETSVDPVIGVYGADAYVEGQRDRNGVWRPFDETVFAYGHCENLLAVVAGDLTGRDASKVAYSILVLTHESGHLRGHDWSEDEAKTENWALRHFVPVAVRLGLSEYQARLLLPWAVEWHRNLNEMYQTPTCRSPVVVDGFLEKCKRWPK